MPLVNNAKNVMLNQLGTVALWASLHNGDPGTTGASEISGGSPAYARKAISWNAAAAGSMGGNALPTLDVPAGTTVSRIGLWSAVTAGTFYAYVPAGGGTVKKVSVDAVDFAADDIQSPAHGFVAGDQVLFYADGGTVPTGLTEGTIYFVIATGLATDKFRVSTTSGGSAVDITAIGQCAVQKILPEVFAGQGTYAVSSATLSLP